MNKVYLLITEGCYGCEVMYKLLNTAIADIKDIDISLIVLDDNSRHNKELRKYFMADDFPTTICVKDDIVEGTYIGTTNYPSLLKWLRKCFSV